MFGIMFTIKAYRLMKLLEKFVSLKHLISKFLKIFQRSFSVMKI